MGQLKDVDKRHKSFVINILLLNFCNCLIHSNIAAPTKSFLKILCLQFVSFNFFSYLCSVFEMHRKRNWGAQNGVFFHTKRGAGVKGMHPAVGADPIATLLRRGWGRSSAPKKRTGHSLAIGVEEDGAFTSVRADDLPQPLRRRVAIGSAPTEEGGKGFIHTKGAMLQCERSVALY